MKKIKKESEREKLDKRIVLFEIILLISSSFSFAILSNDNIGSESFNFDKLFSFFDLIPSVSAQNFGDLQTSIENVPGIIEQVTGGQVGCCFDTDEGLCDPETSKNSCEERANSDFFSDSSCEIQQCSLGCCILGSESQFVTGQRCAKLSESYGVPLNYNPGIKDELSCVNLATSQVKGACVFSGETSGDEKNNCKFTTKDDCNSQIGGSFYEGYLCSNPDLNTVCEKQKVSGCLDSKDEIYWYDSCGNPENIYDSNKERSWNDGKILSKEESCNPNSDNIKASTCGNCNYNEGSICGKFRQGIDSKKKDGDYSCRNLNCKDGFKTRINGDSWCLYDGSVGDGRDVVGSRHFRQLCVNGEIKTEPCADYRGEVCVREGGIGDSIKQTENQILSQFGVSIPNLNSIPGLSGLTGIGGSLNGGGVLSGISGFAVNDILDNGNNSSGNLLDIFKNNNGEIIPSLTSSKAFCRPNTWEDCLGRNIATCNQNKDCKLKIVYVDSDFYFAKCVPQYPPGLDLGSVGGKLKGIGSSVVSQTEIGDNIGAFGNFGSGSVGGGLGSGSGDICSQGSQTCKVVYEKQCPSGKWKCKENCGCEDLKFTLQMNEVCTSLGDCGAYTNIDGKVTSGGYSVSKKGSHVNKPPRLIGIDKIYSVFAKTSGLQGITGSLDGGIYNNVPDISLAQQLGIDVLGNGGGGFGDITPGSGGSQLGNMFSGSNLGGTIGGAAAGGAAGGAVALSGGAWSTSSFGVPAFSSLGAAGFVGVGALAVVGIYYAAGCGQTKEEEVSFTCKPWKQPTAGNCNVCNDDPDKPCSKYRCESLGSNCKLINENTGQDKCVTISDTEGVPILSPDYKVVYVSFRYEDSSSSGFNIRDSNGECIQAFTPIIFGVNTNIPANCKFSEEDLSYEEMEFGFLQGEVYTENHTTSTYLPSVESIIGSESGDSSEFSEFLGNQSAYNYLLNVVGDINLHVKCSSVNGRSNDQDYRINFCVKPGPDLTPPVVIATAPANNALVRNNATEWKPVFFINEPAECRWSLVNENYFNMSNNLGCVEDVDQGTLLGYPCNTTLPLNQQENTFYVSCRDQPWLEENSSRNIGNPYQYTLSKTETTLGISSISPSGNIVKGSEPVSIDLSVNTIGGAENGRAACQYKLGINLNYINFANTLNTVHTQTLNQLRKGNYSLSIRCADIAGNIANGETTFSLDLDTKSPEITRIFHQSGNLVFYTDEEAICSYSQNTCNFNINNGTSISAFAETNHITSWNSNQTYYIKCEDIWGNNPGTCSIIAKPENIIQG